VITAPKPGERIRNLRVIPTLTALLKAARSHEVTPEEYREQRISCAYGNAAIDDPTVTKDHVREADRRIRLEP